MGQQGGPSVLEVVDTMTKSADLEVIAVDLTQAISSLTEALRLLALAAPSEDQRVLHAGILIRRGDARRRQARWAEARADLEGGYMLAVNHGPARAAAAANALGILEKDLGRLAEAEQRYLEAESHLTADQSPDNALRAALAHNLAGLAHARGQFLAAEAHARRALTLHASNCDPSALLADRGVLLAVLVGQGRLIEAEQLAQELIQCWSRLCGPRHYEVAHARHHLATVLVRRGAREQAAEECRQAVAIFSSLLGDDHPETEAARAGLDDLVQVDARGQSRGGV